MRKDNRGLNNTGRIMLIITTVFFVVLFVITGISYANIAITGRVRGENLFAIALNQYLSSGVSQARRGSILDRNGNVISTQLTSYTIFANLNEAHGDVIEDVDYTATRLAEVLDLSKDSIVGTLSQELHHIEFGNAGRQLSFIEKEKITEMNLSGINFREDIQRFYPNAVFASHTIGYTTVEHDGFAGSFTGVMGIESYFNDVLTGVNGEFQFLRDRDGFLQPNQDVRYIQETRNGYDVHLTIDSTIQIFLETAMNEVQEKAEPESMVAIVADAKTGEILALANRPTFDPNIREIEDFTDATVYPFEPGSTLKVFTYAAAINEGNYQGDQRFLSGTRDLPGDTTIGDFDRTWGYMTFDEGFYRSSNTAIIDMLDEWISPSLFLQYLEKFGFGSPVGMPLFGENAGSLPSGNSIVDIYMSGFGQAITVTPMQQVQALTAILNEGQLIRPQIISRITDPDNGEVLSSFERDVIGEPVTASTARQVMDLMIGTIVNEIGSGRDSYTLDEATSGGKTGTAQIPDLINGGYLDGIHVYSYIGFAPAENPELIMFVAVQNPDTEQASGHPYAGHIYRFVMNNALSYLGLRTSIIDESNMPNFERNYVPNILNLPTEIAISELESAGFEAIVIGNGDRVFKQSPPGSSNVLIGEKVFIQTDVEDRLPDFTGWSRAQINQYQLLLGIDIEFDGTGLAVRQSLRPRTAVRSGDTIRIVLEQ